MSKILIVSDYKDKIWWVETYIYDLKKILEKNWHVVKIFWWKWNSRYKRWFFVFLSIFNFKKSNEIKKLIEEFQPDLIWCHSVSRYLGHKVLEQINKFTAIKIITYHDLWYFAGFANKVFTEQDIPEKFELSNFLKRSKKAYWLYVMFKFLKLSYIRKQLQKFDIHTVPSKFMLKYVIKHNYWEEKKVKILPNFILKEKIWERQNIMQDKINFIFFGRLEKEKWIWFIIYFLSELRELKFKDRKKYEKIKNKVRFFIFWNWAKKKDLLNIFTWTNLHWEDIWFVQNLENCKIDLNELNKNKIVYYFWTRDFETIKKFLSFSHYNLVPSLFLETFWLSAAEACANKVVNIWFDKPNITNFILPDYKICWNNLSENFSKKMFDIIENFNKTNRENDSKKSFNLVSNFII